MQGCSFLARIDKIEKQGISRLPEDLAVASLTSQKVKHFRVDLLREWQPTIPSVDASSLRYRCVD